MEVDSILGSRSSLSASYLDLRVKAELGVFVRGKVSGNWGDPKLNLYEGLSSGQHIGQILLSQHSPFPCGDMWDCVRQKPKRIIGREDWDSEHIPQSN